MQVTSSNSDITSQIAARNKTLIEQANANLGGGGKNYNILDYNATLSAIKRGRQNLNDYQKIADEATNPEEKKKFQDAVDTASKLLDLDQKRLGLMSSSLHLDQSITSSGKLMSWDGYEAYKANGYKSNASILGGLISMNESDFASYKDYYDKNVKKPFHQGKNMDSIDFMA